MADATVAATPQEPLEQQPAPAQQTEAQRKSFAFNNEQQEMINALINTKYREAYEKAESKYQKELSTLKSELDSVKTQKAQQEQKPGKEAKADNTAEVKTLHDKLAEAQKVMELHELEKKMLQEKQAELNASLEREKKERLLERKRNTIMAAATKSGFIDPHIVQRLVEDAITYDEAKNDWRVHNESGQERWNKNLQPMSIEEFFSEYAEKHPYLVRGSNMSGTGSMESNGTKNKKVWRPSEIANLSPSDYEKHRADIIAAQRENRISPS